MMSWFLRSAKIFTLVLLGGASAFGQQAAPGTASQPAPNQMQPQAPAPATGIPNPAGSNVPGNNGLAQPALLTPIYGVQGVLAETVDGTTLAAQSVDQKFNPASSIKLATTLVALQTFGPNHRFLTSVWAAGTIDKTTGTLNGDLIISGR